MALISRVHGRQLSRGMLQHYTREGYLKPRAVGDSPAGRGRPPSVFYDATDIVLLGWLVRLADEGIKVKKFAQGIASLRQRVPEALRAPQALFFFIIDGDDIAVRVGGGPAIQLTGSEGQVLLTFSSARDIREVVEGGWSLVEQRNR